RPVAEIGKAEARWIDVIERRDQVRIGPSRIMRVDHDLRIARAIRVEDQPAIGNGAAAGVAVRAEDRSQIDLVRARREVGDVTCAPRSNLEYEGVAAGAAGHHVGAATT